MGCGWMVVDGQVDQRKEVEEGGVRIWVGDEKWTIYIYIRQ